MKKVGIFLFITLILSGVATWFLILNINYYASINLFGYKLENISVGALTLVSFIGGGILIWFISFIAQSLDVSALQKEIDSLKKELSKKDEEIKKLKENLPKEISSSENK